MAFWVAMHLLPAHVSLIYVMWGCTTGIHGLQHIYAQVTFTLVLAANPSQPARQPLFEQQDAGGGQVGISDTPLAENMLRLAALSPL